MELPWNICPFCGTPAAGMRRGEGTSMDEALRSLKVSSTTSGSVEPLNDEPGEVKIE
jgi:hypothetical protein